MVARSLLRRHQTKPSVDTPAVTARRIPLRLAGIGALLRRLNDARRKEMREKPIARELGFAAQRGGHLRYRAGGANGLLDALGGMARDDTPSSVENLRRRGAACITLRWVLKKDRSTVGFALPRSSSLQQRAFGNHRLA